MEGVAADKRGNKTVRDLALSMVVLGVVVFGIYLFVPHGNGKRDPVKTETVSYNVELEQARRDAPYPVLGPTGLGARWRATSVQYSGADRRNVTWHLGFVDPEEQYVALEQTNGAAKAFAAQVTIGSHPDPGSGVAVAGATWQHWSGGRYDALVRTDKGVTTVVMGTAPQSQLVRLATSLRPTG
ncbi:Protein of unknown function [Actinacidiphila guanduensis]|jgi:D-serine deaminase-like pyridoxal phosphate-dependent protein|uniref:DUF4245 domain-containing protein n=1 Tax=Actinacidiphila guanduensis TaxID=310781 RepID=A0A1H0AAR8_9ACTN|nr:Protein of unknown function [Actinacidiphila guanduensis]